MVLMTVMPCIDLDAMVAFLVDECGARIEAISPADAPRDVTMTVHGSTVCVRRFERDEPVTLIVRSALIDAATTRVAPNGSVIELRPDSVDVVVVPPVVASVSVLHAGDGFAMGRAGMAYRDLLPDRWGGAYIASHILIRDGGDVADYVHFHRVRFQMIFCARGWVDVVYEDQGEPFRLNQGDCVLQPPEIRHRVLRSSTGLEVIEIGCPAVHDTLVEHEITLPTPHVDARREFGGQRFVRHVADGSPRVPYPQPALVARDTGIGAATDDLAGAIVVEAAGSSALQRPIELTNDGEFAFVVALGGTAVLTIDGAGTTPRREHIAARDAVAFAPGTTWSWSGWTEDFEFLEVSLPAGGVRASGGELDVDARALLEEVADGVGNG